MDYDFTYTGAEIQAILDTAKKLKDSGYIFLGVATPSTNPGTPTQKVYYEAKQAGTYTNFGGVVLPDGISLLKWNGSWTSETVMCGDGGVFDISVYKSSGGTLAKYTDLAAALGTNGANIPQSLRKGGMSVKFVQSSDNKYIRYNLLADSFTTDTTQWAIADEGVYVENPEFVAVFTDIDKKIILAVEKNGNIKFGAGVPKQIIDYINEKIAELSLDEYENIVSFLGSLIDGDKTLLQLLNGKVDKADGKSLIDEDVAGSLNYCENPEYIDVETDADKKLISAIRKNGIKVFYAGCEIDGTLLKRVSHPEFIDVWVDKDNKIVGSLSKAGEWIFSGISINKLFQNVEQIKKDSNSFCIKNWKDKNLWWCGTSIPAAGYWNVDNMWAYPNMVGVNIGARRVYNEAVGSSCAKYSADGGTYEVVSRRMGNSIADALAICADLWTIDDVNNTVTEGPRIKGITAIPNVSSYSDACYQRYCLLSNCYEIKLVSKYLISDPEENEAYLMGKFGDLYNILTSLNPNAYNYQGDIDLFIIDHGHNDNPSPVSESDIDTTDITTFAGAINTYIRLIMQYKPHARIMFISDYDNEALSRQTIEAQRQIAEHWHIPFIDLRKHLPFDINQQVKVRGYWGTDGLWKETGFTYNPNAGSVATAFSVNGDAYFNPYLGSTIQGIAGNIRPTQDSNGVWWYYLYPRYVWIRDGLHPHSDASGRCNKLYAKVLSEFINQN